MYKDVLRAIEGVSIFPIISLVMFVLFFSLVLYATLSAGKDSEGKMALMPLDEGDDQIDNEKNHNHV